MLQLLVFQPLYNLLAFLSNLLKGELGWAVLILAALIRFAIWPWYRKAMGDQRKMTKLQPQIKELQKKHKQDPMKANQEVMKILQAEKINLGGSFLFLFFQIGIFIVLFFFFNQAINNDWSPFLYSFIKLPAEINYIFLGLVDLKSPSLILAIISASLNSLLTFIQPSTGQNKAMILGLPFIILLFYQRFPAIVILYWIGFSLVNILQEFLIKNKKELEPILANNPKQFKITKKNESGGN
jgi:YidC/Oxa1 family membrane protein insertase